MIDTRLRVPVYVQISQRLGAGGVHLVARIVDLVGKVGAGEHVIVHEQANLLVLLRRQSVGVKVGPEKTLLLA